MASDEDWIHIVFHSACEYILITGVLHVNKIEFGKECFIITYKNTQHDMKEYNYIYF